MTNFVKENDAFFLISDSPDIRPVLPGKAFKVLIHPEKGYYLREVQTQPMPSKLYGNTTDLAVRFFNTYHARGKNTGVHLTGEQGSGKSLLLRALGELAMANNMPVLMIEDDYTGPDFTSFLASIAQPCMLAFDEFEKTYSQDTKQEALLPTLDGLFKSNKLVVLTSNDRYKVIQQLNNRTGRIYYYVEYKGLSEQEIREYCADRLLNKGHTESVVTVSYTLDSLNFDSLSGLVEEMNRYGEEAEVAIRLLNIRPLLSKVRYKVSAESLTGKPGKFVASCNSSHNHNPLSKSVTVVISKPAKVNEEWGGDTVAAVDLKPNQVTSTGPDGIVFEKDGWRLTFVREESGAHTY